MHRLCGAPYFCVDGCFCRLGVSDTGDASAENVSGDMIRIESRVGDIYLLADGAENDYSVNGTGNGQKTIYAKTDMGDTKIAFTENIVE